MFAVFSWWRKLVDGLASMRSFTRYASRFGRMFGLRDRGRLQEALDEGLALAKDILSGGTPMERIQIVVAASTIDDLAQRLGQPEAAYEVLTRAIATIDEAQEGMVSPIRKKPDDFASKLESYRRAFQESVNRIVSERNA
jgi:hypothetical protein